MEQALSTSTRSGLRLEAAISWSAIVAGALAALAVSMILTLLAVGFDVKLGFGGLASRGSLSTFTPIIGAVAIAIQVLAGGLGGYLAGRLRHVWFDTHSDEAHFRDTAHGLITWALATVAGVVLATMVLTPYAEQLSTSVSIAPVVLSAAQAERAANIAAQSAFFTAIGMLLSAFTAAVAARLGGLQTEEMHARFGK